MRITASADGTPIAFDEWGTGPSLLFVHGMTGNRSNFGLIRPRLEDHFTVVAMDRRGRGDSGDNADYAIEREIEDIVAVVQALDAPVLLFGHSFGALCALEAAMRSDRLSGLILYEPGISLEGEPLYAPSQLTRLDALLAAGDREGVVRTLLVDIAAIPPHEMDLIMQASGREKIASAHTIPREAHIEAAYRLDADRARKLTIPVLLLLGGDSPPPAEKVNSMFERALPNARTTVLRGQRHVAMRTGPDVLVDAILDFHRDIA